MGVGLFAKRNLKVRQVIFSERPLLIYPKGLPLYGNFSEEEAIKQQNALFEDTLQKALSVMSKEHVDAYLRLSNCLPNYPPLFGIANTNAFGTGSDIEEENIQEGKFEYGVVAELASRINHRYVAQSQFSSDS
jgi:hypothetical protein